MKLSLLSYGYIDLALGIFFFLSSFLMKKSAVIWRAMQLHYKQAMANSSQTPAPETLGFKFDHFL